MAWPGRPRYLTVRVDETLWEIPRAARADMRVPARIFADAELLHDIAADRALEQLLNVATLPGIVEAALAMPDIHEGYGFPVGGVAAISAPMVSSRPVGSDMTSTAGCAARPACRGRARRTPRAARARDSRAEPAAPAGTARLLLGDGELAAC